MYPSSPWRGETAASRDDNFRRVPCISNTPKVPSLSSPSLILKGFWFWDQDARILPCTMFRGPSAGPGTSVVSANNLDREVKGHGKFEHRPGSFGRVFNTWERACEICYRLIWWIDDLLCIHYHLDVVRQLHQEMAIFDEYLASSKVRMCNTPKFPWLSSPSLILKGFWFWDRDARILPCTMSSTMLRGPSAGQCKQSGSRGEKAWKFWKTARIFRKSLQHLGKGFCEIWYRWSIMYPSSPWRGETAALRDGNFGRVPCIIQSSNVQHPNFHHLRHLHSSWKGFDSGIRMQGYCLVQCSGVHQQVLADQWSVRTNWIARWKGMENLKGRDLLEESSKAGKGYLWDMISIFETAASRDGNFRRVPCIIQSSNVQHPNFRHFRHLHSSWKGSDSGIRMQGYCLLPCSVQCSGVHQQFLADQWSVPTTEDGKIE